MYVQICTYSIYVRTVEPRNYEHKGTVKMHSPHQQFVLTDTICIEKALKGTEIVFVLTVFVLTRFYCNVCRLLDSQFL